MNDQYIIMGISLDTEEYLTLIQILNSEDYDLAEDIYAEED